MVAGKNRVIYMGLISGPNKADDTCQKTTVTGTMERGSTVPKLTLSCIQYKTLQYKEIPYVFSQRHK
jgi:hypothetical protein